MLKPKGTFRGGDSSCLLTQIIDNSDAIRAFDAVYFYTNGDVAVAVAAYPLGGVVVEICDAYGHAMSPTKASNYDAPDATIDTSVNPFGVTVGSDNETDDGVVARVDIDPQSIYSGDIEAAETVGTTVSSNKPGCWMDLADQRTLDETTATRTIGTGGQMGGLGTDPSDSGNILCYIHESEFFTLGKVLAET